MVTTFSEAHGGFKELISQLTRTTIDSWQSVYQLCNGTRTVMGAVKFAITA